MRTVRVTVTGVDVSPPIPVDQYLTTTIGLGVLFGGAATATVEHTFDDVFAEDFNPLTATWFDHETLAGITANEDGNYIAPPIACRLNVTVGPGPVELIVNQAGATS